MQINSSPEQTALEILRDPNACAADAIRQAAAWVTLKQARGQTVVIEHIALRLLEERGIPANMSTLAATERKIHHTVEDANRHSPDQMARIRAAARTTLPCHAHSSGPYGGDAA